MPEFKENAPADDKLKPEPEKKSAIEADDQVLLSQIANVQSPETQPDINLELSLEVSPVVASRATIATN